MILLPMIKLAVVTTSGPLLDLSTKVKERELMTASISHMRALNFASSTDNFPNVTRTARLAEPTGLPQNPPHHGVCSMLNFHMVPCSAAKFHMSGGERSMNWGTQNTASPPK